jgi:hypothetical protein
MSLKVLQHGLQHLASLIVQAVEDAGVNGF